jgi:hypothetical protein
VPLLLLALHRSTIELLTPVPTATTSMVQKSLHEFSVLVVANMPTGPAVNIGDKNFEIRTRMITMVHANPLCGLPNEEANAHL